MGHNENVNMKPYESTRIYVQEQNFNDTGNLPSSSVIMTVVRGTRKTLESAVFRETENFSDFSTSRSSLMEMLKQCDRVVESKVKSRVTGMKSSPAVIDEMERGSIAAIKSTSFICIGGEDYQAMQPVEQMQKHNFSLMPT